MPSSSSRSSRSSSSSRSGGRPLLHPRARATAWEPRARPCRRRMRCSRATAPATSSRARARDTRTSCSCMRPGSSAAGRSERQPPPQASTLAASLRVEVGHNPTVWLLNRMQGSCGNQAMSSCGGGSCDAHAIRACSSQLVLGVHAALCLLPCSVDYRPRWQLPRSVLAADFLAAWDAAHMQTVAWQYSSVGALQEVYGRTGISAVEAHMHVHVHCVGPQPKWNKGRADCHDSFCVHM